MKLLELASIIFCTHEEMFELDNRLRFYSITQFIILVEDIRAEAEVMKSGGGNIYLDVCFGDQSNRGGFHELKLQDFKQWSTLHERLLKSYIQTNKKSQFVVFHGDKEITTSK
jgi:hypothetical protein